eukprot:UC4_evm2s808
MDEPTASCDMETDAKLQSLVRERFDNMTIITIAHRLNTVIDYDQILVLDKGEVVEFDTPSTLLDTQDGYFKKMVDAMGEKTAKKLREKACNSIV